MLTLEEKISAAKGETTVDLLLKNGNVVNVFSGEIHPANVAVHQGIVVGFGDYNAKTVVDLGGAFVAPGFMDGHVHLESVMVTVPEFAWAVLPRGTTSIVADPHEIANVSGLEGIRYIIRSAEGVPLNVFVMAPSCVPATHLESSGASLSAADLVQLLDEPSVIGLAEMMNYPGVLFKVPEVLDKIHAFGSRPKDGHAPGLSGKDLAAYISAGIRSDHECTTREEALEKLRLGMTIMIREGTAAKNLETLLPLVKPENAHRFVLCTDDRHPFDLVQEGHIDHLLRKAVRLGLDPIFAIRMATLNTALYFGIPDLGAVAPGYRADLVILDDLSGFNVRHVIKDGKIVIRNGEWAAPIQPKKSASFGTSVHIGRITAGQFAIPVQAGKKIKVIEIIPNQIVTNENILDPKIEAGLVVPDVKRDIAKLAVVERHHATGRIGLGFVCGLGFKKGALASSVAHDSHNIIATGMNDDDLFAAVSAVAKMGGGLAVVVDGEVVKSLALPVAGLLSEEPLEKVAESVEALKTAVKGLGCAIEDPFMTLAFLALPVIPKLKLTDRGLVDVGRFDFTDLFTD